MIDIIYALVLEGRVSSVELASSSDSELWLFRSVLAWKIYPFLRHFCKWHKCTKHLNISFLLF